MTILRFLTLNSDFIKHSSFYLRSEAIFCPMYSKKIHAEIQTTDVWVRGHFNESYGLTN
jgi:hypothetical protein